MLDKVHVKAPATSANLGPAYDVLGLALDLWLDVTVERLAADATTSVTMRGEGESEIAGSSSENLIVTCFNKALALCGKEPFPIKVTVNNEIPFGCGCGSSSAATVAGVVAAFLMCEHPLSAKTEELLQIATQIEGHPDNAAPAIYGGMRMGLNNGERWVTHAIAMSSVYFCVLFVPFKKMKLHTSETRKLIPQEMPMKTAVHNMARSMLLVHSFATNDVASLKECADDMFHQQQRAPLFPHMNPAVAAAMAHGAVYACLSGAGPSVIAFVVGRSGDAALLPASEQPGNAVGAAMVAAAAAAGIEGRFIVTQPSAQGTHRVRE